MVEGYQQVSYFKLKISPTKIRQMLRFRLGCHNLPVVSGRHNGIPRHERTCPRYHTGRRDEKHLVFECSALDDIRQEFQILFCGTFDMCTFMNQPNKYAVVDFICLHFACDDEFPRYWLTDNVQTHCEQ